jgi:hypothetical protein
MKNKLFELFFLSFSQICVWPTRNCRVGWIFAYLFQPFPAFSAFFPHWNFPLLNNFFLLNSLKKIHMGYV